MSKDEALRLALEALADLGTKHYENTGEVLYKNTYTAIKAALEAKDEPVTKAIEEQAYESGYSTGFMDGAIKAQEAKDEPVGVVATDTSKTHLYYGTQYLGQKTDTKMVMLFKDLPLGTSVYTAPPHRKPLTEEKFKHMPELFVVPPHHVEMVVRAIEAAHGIKGGSMTDEQVEKIIKSNMMLQMNLAGIRADFEKALQRTWVGLTDEDEIPWDGVDAKSFAKAIEAKLKEKNT